MVLWVLCGHFLLLFRLFEDIYVIKWKEKTQHIYIYIYIRFHVCFHLLLSHDCEK